MSELKPDAGEMAGDVSDAMRAALESVERAEGADVAAASPASSSTIAQLETELKEVRAQLDLSVQRARETLDRLKETHERHLRAVADLENYKKRAVREKEEVERFGIQRLLKDLLPVMDNLDRALDHAGLIQGPMAEGVSATRKIFEETLGRHGVKGFTAVGQAFDPTRHEAMQQVETAEAAPGTVVSEMVRGYLLHDRLVRPALVAVAIAPTTSPTMSSEGEGLPPEAEPEASPAASGTEAGEGS